jgi:hypothetical protein
LGNDNKHIPMEHQNDWEVSGSCCVGYVNSSWHLEVEYGELEEAEDC